ncbi:MAG TPA: hypothetical protein VGG66_02505 [Rhizomicrobium sp.]|jgi:hypothetical protein
MPEYEIRVLKTDCHSPSVIFEQSYSDDEAAVRAASGFANGAAFEVWRDLDRVDGLFPSHAVAA